MARAWFRIVAAASLLLAPPVLAQTPAAEVGPGAPVFAAPAAVQAEPLPVLDLFSVGAEGPGLGPELWKNSSADLARTVLPLLASKPLSPAFSSFARRVLSTAATGPKDAGSDPLVAAQRLDALLAQGDAAGVDAIASKTGGLAGSAELSQAGAEAALILGQDDKACAIGDALTNGRDNLYWLRLRAYCQARAGNAAAAQLTVDLAEAQATDAVFRRFITVLIAGGGDPGAASLRGGLDLAMSRRLGLATSAAKPSPAIAAALKPPVTTAASGPLGAAAALAASGDVAAAKAVRAGLERNDAAGVTALDLALLDAILASAEGLSDQTVLDQLIERGGVGEGADRKRAQAAAALYAAVGAAPSPAARAAFAGFDIGAGKTPSARLAASDMAASARAMGDAALLALWIAADAGPAGPAPADQARIVAALIRAGLDEPARPLAVEALMRLQAPSLAIPTAPAK